MIKKRSVEVDFLGVKVKAVLSGFSISPNIRKLEFETSDEVGVRSSTFFNNIGKMLKTADRRLVHRMILEENPGCSLTSFEKGKTPNVCRLNVEDARQYNWVLRYPDGKELVLITALNDGVRFLANGHGLANPVDTRHVTIGPVVIDNETGPGFTVIANGYHAIFTQDVFLSAFVKTPS